VDGAARLESSRLVGHGDGGPVGSAAMSARTKPSPTVPQREVFSSVVVAAKLQAPPLRPGRVARERLVAPLRDVAHKLAVIEAPPGSGKTTLLAEWQQTLGNDSRLAWLSLDDADNDPAQFWTYVVEALRTVEPGFGATALAFLKQRPQDVLELALPTLLNDLAELEKHVVLVLDDYHVIREHDVHAGLEYVVDHLPPILKLAIATRTEPPLPLARWRARGELVDVRADALRFTREEAAAVLDGLGIDLDADDAAELHRRTEGWAAGLYLAALSLRGRTDRPAFISSFAGDNRDLVDYLITEVLAEQPEDMRHFLLRSSILRRFCAPLCEAVTDSGDAPHLLAKADRANLFLMPLDDRREWYRYHQLFRQLLVLELERTEPGLAPALHGRASQWYRASGDVGEAIHHALVADDIADAAMLIHDHWNAFFNHGRHATVAAWLDRLPLGFVEQDRRLAVARAWLALDRGELAQAGRWIATAEAARPEPDPDIALLRAVHRFKVGDLGAAQAAALQAVELEPNTLSFAHTVADCILGIALYWTGHDKEAASALREVVHFARQGGNRLGAAYALGYEALTVAELGQLDEAERAAVAAIHESDEPGFKEHFVLTIAHLALAEVGRRHGRLADAEHAAARSVELSRRGAGRLETGLALIALARAKQSSDHLVDARELAIQSIAIFESCADTGTVGTRALEAGRRLLRPRSKHGPELRDELSPRELAVLQLLSTQLSQREIGGELYVSLNTVKTHVRSIHRKLGTATREETVERARGLGLV
jgi:LuxR family transcriptional regulator, maltose regulon positive regulatory protein